MVKPSSLAIPSVSVNTSSFLSVTVPAETMFDPDDEEPTSPQVVQDIIASLDSEEEDRSVGCTEAVAGRVGDSGTGTISARNVAEDVARQKPVGGGNKRVVEDSDKESEGQVDMKSVNGETSAVNGRTNGECRETGIVASERDDTSLSLKCKQPEVQNETRAGACATNSLTPVDTMPKFHPIAACLKTTEPSKKELKKCVVDKVGNEPIVSNEVASHVQSNGSVSIKIAGEGVNESQRRAGVSHTQFATSSKLVVEAAKHTNSADAGRCDTLRTSEVLIEKRQNPSALSAVPNPRSIPSSATVTLLGNAVQTPSLSKDVEQAFSSKRIPCYAPLLGDKEKKRASTTIEDSPLVSSSKSSETSSKHPSEKSSHVSKEKVVGMPDAHQLTMPSAASKIPATSRRIALKIPKAQYTIHNITKPTFTQLPNEKYAPILTTSKPQPFAVRNAGLQPNTAPKRWQEKSVTSEKRAKIQHDGSNSTRPLDLSNPAKKTVAADSTSMLSGSPTPSPKPKLPKLKTGRSQNIHSIVDSLANRDHISLKAVSPEISAQVKKLSSHSEDSKLTEDVRKRSPSQVNIADVLRKEYLQSSKTTAAAAPRKPSHFTQPTVPVSSPMSPHRPLPMSLPIPESASCYLPPGGGLCSPPLHVDTSLASRLSYDMAMRNLLTLSHMAMAQGGMVRPQHMFPMQPHMFPPRPKSHDFHPIPDPSLLRQQSEARMGAASKKASPTAGTTAPQLRTPAGLTSASIQHMEDLTRTVGKRAEKERHSVTVTPIPFKG